MIMEFLADILSPHQNFIGQTAGMLTLMQFLSGVFMLWDIKKHGQSDSFPPEPFLGGIVLSALSIKLGQSMNDNAMQLTNIAGAIINVIYMLIFYYYANNTEFKNKICKKTIYCTAFIAAIFAYAMIEDPAQLEIRLGMVITGFMVVLLGSPLLSIKTYIKNKSSEGLALPYIVSGNIVGTSWFLYAISIRNFFFAYQNLFLISLSAIQLAICIIYPVKNAPTTKRRNSDENVTLSSSSESSSSKNNLRKREPFKEPNTEQ